MNKRIAVLPVFILSAAASVLALVGAPFGLDSALDGILITTIAGLNGTVFCLNNAEEVNHIDFDGNVLDPIKVNEFDRLVMNPYSVELDGIGTGIGIVSILTPAVLFGAPRDQWITIGTIYAETMFLAYGLKELGKLYVNRARPYMYFKGFPRNEVDEGDWNKSFPSGHATLAFAGASFTGYVFSEYFPDSNLKIPVYVSSYILAICTAACRVAGGNHFLTDVIAGAAIGTACGFFVPWIHSLNINPKQITAECAQRITARVMPTGFLLSIRY